MLTAVKGIYKDGKVELLEFPVGLPETPVVVTFLEQPQERNGSMMTFGMFKGPIQSSEDDFKLADFDEKRVLEKWERANRDD